MARGRSLWVRRCRLPSVSRDGGPKQHRNALGSFVDSCAPTDLERPTRNARGLCQQRHTYCRFQCRSRQARPSGIPPAGRFRTEARRPRAPDVSGLPGARNVPYPGGSRQGRVTRSRHLPAPSGAVKRRPWRVRGRAIGAPRARSRSLRAQPALTGIRQQYASGPPRRQAPIYLMGTRSRRPRTAMSADRRSTGTAVVSNARLSC